MCTENSTFNVKCAETSNLVMLVPSVIGPMASVSGDEAKRVPVVAVGTSKSTFVLLDAVPRLDQLEAAFNEFTYLPGASDSASGVSLTELESLVQASRSEILSGLIKLGVAETPATEDGIRRWCKIDNQHKLKVSPQVSWYFLLISHEFFSSDLICCRLKNGRHTLLSAFATLFLHATILLLYD